jgi:uncharacterized protein (UPF0332 family)
MGAATQEPITVAGGGRARRRRRPMNRELVLAEWQHARDALKAAEMLTWEDLSADAISRAYYAVLHAAKAALHVQEVAVESHAAVKRTLFAPGRLRPSGRLTSEEAWRSGLAADYDTEALFSADDAEEKCRRRAQVHCTYSSLPLEQRNCPCRAAARPDLFDLQDRRSPGCSYKLLSSLRSARKSAAAATESRQRASTLLDCTGECTGRAGNREPCDLPAEP